MGNLNKSRSGQAATEFMMVVGISLLLLSPIITIGNQAVVDLKRTTDYVLSRDAVDRISDMANIVYAQGAPAKITDDIRFPSNVQSITIAQNSVVFRMNNGGVVNDVVEVMDYDISGTLTTNPGTHRISVEATSGGVVVSEIP